MAKGYKFPSSGKTKRTFSIEQFRGVDFAESPLEVAAWRSPDAVNLIPAAGGWPETRPGINEVLQLDGRINGIHTLYTAVGGVRLVHHGEKISYWRADGSVEELYSGAKNAKSCAVQLKERLLILDGKAALLVVNDDGKPKVTTLNEGAYVPTTTIGRKADEQLGGSALEDINMVGAARKNTFCVDAEGKTKLYVDAAPVKRFIKAEQLLENGIWAEVNWKSEDLVAGCLTFDVLSPTPVSGMDNYRVEFEVENLGEADRREEYTTADAARCDKEGVEVWAWNSDHKYYAKKWWFKIGENLPREEVEAVIVTENTFYGYVYWEGRDTPTKPKSRRYALSIKADDREVTLPLGYADESYDESESDISGENNGPIHLEAELVQENGCWYLTVTDPHRGHGGGIDGVSSRGSLEKVIISWRESGNNLYMDKINGCTVAGVFGVGGNADRVFITGNAAYRNMDWMSGFEDVTYWPDMGYTRIGSEGSAVVGYSWLADGVQAIHKEEAAGGQHNMVPKRPAEQCGRSGIYPDAGGYRCGCGICPVLCEFRYGQPYTIPPGCVRSDAHGQ